MLPIVACLDKLIPSLRHARRPWPKTTDASRTSGRLVVVSDTVGRDVLEEIRRRRLAGDSRVTPEGRAIFDRITDGDLADAFADSLDEIAEADPLLSGHPELGA